MWHVQSQKSKCFGFVNVVFNSHVGEDRPEKTLIFFVLTVDLFPMEADYSLESGLLVIHTVYY